MKLAIHIDSSHPTVVFIVIVLSYHGYPCLQSWYQYSTHSLCLETSYSTSIWLLSDHFMIQALIGFDCQCLYSNISITQNSKGRGNGFKLSEISSEMFELYTNILQGIWNLVHYYEKTWTIRVSIMRFYCILSKGIVKN